MMEDIIARYTTLGFSYAICIYLLYERSREHASFKQVLIELVGVIKSLDQLIRDRVK